MTKILLQSKGFQCELRRALHVLADQISHILEDDIGLKLIDPDENRRNKGQARRRHKG